MIILCGIGKNTYIINEYAIVTFYIKNRIPQSKNVFLKIIKKMHIVNNFKANIFLGIDMFGFKKAIINIF